MESNTREVVNDLSPIIKHYADGTIERLVNFPYVPPSPDDPNTAVSSKDTTISSLVPARIYLPKPSNPTEKLPIYLYFHGGGFCIGSAFGSLDHRYMTHLSGEARALIVSVEYRLAPENPLPAAYEDSWTSLKWVCSHALGNETKFKKEPWILNHGDFSRIFVGGESAGGNIAHNLAMRAGWDLLPGNLKIYGAILSHPGFWGSKLIGPEPREDIGQHLLDRMWVFVYPTCPGGIDDPVINPIADGAPSLSGFGCEKVLICASEKDILTDWVLGYAERLKGSGWRGEAEVVVVEGEDHCFHVFDSETDKAKNLIKRMASFLSN